ncbi:Wzz/FepE/Etk N-terminal domain-containing protein [Bacillus paralicheniformis]|nr:Wzz/FepE/Etk N-terminal domain-containing protein [Bacillus paralicheniformis]
MKENIDFRELIAILRKRTVLILVLTIGVTLTTGIIQFYVLTPVYQASTQILVHQVGEKKGAPRTAIFKSTCNTRGHSKRF